MKIIAVIIIKFGMIMDATIINFKQSFSCGKKHMGHPCEVVTATTQPLRAATIAAQAVTTRLHRPTPDTNRQTDRQT